MASIRCPVKEASLISLHEPAILVGDRRFIYSEYDQYVSVTAGKLRSLGVESGERVALMLPDDWILAVLMMALFRAGGVPCPLPPGAGPDGLAAFLRGTGCRRAIVAAKSTAFTGTGVMMHEADDVIGFFSDDISDECSAVIPMEQVATVFAASNAVGDRQRLVVHSYGSHYYGARGFNHAMRTSSHSRWLLTSPLWTIEGFCTAFRCAMNGGTLVIPGARQKVADAVQEFGVTHLSTSAAEVEALLDVEEDREALSTLRAIVVEGSDVAHAVVELGRLWSIGVCCSFGVPEMGPGVTLNRSDAPPERRQGAGPVLKYAQVRIAPDGAVLVRGEMLFDGYLEGAGVERTLDADGWFPLGRKGRIDEAGCLLITK